MNSEIDLKKLGFKEPKEKKYQVRFWAEDKNLYLNFIDQVRNNGRVVQDVFNDL